MPTDDHDGETPTDAFATLGNETRMAIVRELADAGAIGPDAEAVPFEKLRESVGVEDSGRFNYHIGELRGHFVERTGDGYVLSYGGREVVAAVHAGTYTDDHAVTGPHPCPVCDAEAEATYDDGFLAIECPNEHPVRSTFPPGAAADRSLDELVSAAMLVTRQKVERVLEGICAQCSGPLGTPAIRTETVPIGPDGPFEAHLLTWECPRCGGKHSVTPGMVAFRHPTVRAFHYERGVDLLEERLLAHEWVLPGAETLLQEDPYRFEVAITLDGECLEVVVDEEGSVLETRQE